MLAVGLALGAAGLFMISRLPDHGSYAAHILPSFVINAAGAGLTYATLFMVATAGVRSQEAGLASGIINTSQQLGAAIGLSALAAVAASRTAHLLHGAGSPAEPAHALVAGFQRGFLIAGTLVIAAAVVAILTVRRHDLEQLPEEAPAKPRSLNAEMASPPAANGQGEILIAFDGSENARHAIQVAARELGGGRAAVLNVWEPFVDGPSTLCISCPPAVAIQPPTVATGEAVEVEAESALATAEEGAALAREAGFYAEPHSLRTDGSIGEAIVGYADEHPTRLVVIGTRGISGLREALTGSVTHHVSEHVHVPLLAVPPAHESERSGVPDLPLEKANSHAANA